MHHELHWIWLNFIINVQDVAAKIRWIIGFSDVAAHGK